MKNRENNPGWVMELVIMGIVCLLVGLVFTFGYAFATVFLGCCALFLVGLLNRQYLLKKKQWMRTLGFLIGLGLTVFIMLFIYIQTQIHSAIPREVLDQPYEYIIVLGGGTKDGIVKEGLQNRLDKTLEVYEDYPEAMYLLTGGIGPGEEISEASAMRDYLVSKGMKEGQLILEDASMSTADNFDFCKEILSQLGVMDHRMLVITSDYHINRALYLAYDRGYTADGLASKTKTSLLLESTTREFYATIKTNLLD